jgi:hypothetical protein
MGKHLGAWLQWDATTKGFAGARACGGGRVAPRRRCRTSRERGRGGPSACKPAFETPNRRPGKEVPGVGIYHEAYLVRPGEYEVVYRNMPRTGLARVGRVVSVSARAGFGGLWGRAAHGRRCAAETAARVPHTPCSDPPRPAPPRPAPPRPAPPRPAPPRPAPPRPAPPRPAPPRPAPPRAPGVRGPHAHGRRPPGAHRRRRPRGRGVRRVRRRWHCGLGPLPGRPTPAALKFPCHPSLRPSLGPSEPRVRPTRRSSLLLRLGRRRPQTRNSAATRPLHRATAPAPPPAARRRSTSAPPAGAPPPPVRALAVQRPNQAKQAPPRPPRRVLAAPF